MSRPRLVGAAIVGVAILSGCAVIPAPRGAVGAAFVPLSLPPPLSLSWYQPEPLVFNPPLPVFDPEWALLHAPVLRAEVVRGPYGLPERIILPP